MTFHPACSPPLAKVSKYAVSNGELREPTCVEKTGKIKRKFGFVLPCISPGLQWEVFALELESGKRGHDLLLTLKNFPLRFVHFIRP